LALPRFLDAASSRPLAGAHLHDPFFPNRPHRCASQTTATTLVRLRPVAEDWKPFLFFLRFASSPVRARTSLFTIVLLFLCESPAPSGPSRPFCDLLLSYLLAGVAFCARFGGLVLVVSNFLEDASLIEQLFSALGPIIFRVSSTSSYLSRVSRSNSLADPVYVPRSLTDTPTFFLISGLPASGAFLSDLFSPSHRSIGTMACSSRSQHTNFLLFSSSPPPFHLLPKRQI